MSDGNSGNVGRGGLQAACYANGMCDCNHASDCDQWRKATRRRPSEAYDYNSLRYSESPDCGSGECDCTGDTGCRDTSSSILITEDRQLPSEHTLQQMSDEELWAWNGKVCEQVSRLAAEYKARAGAIGEQAISVGAIESGVTVKPISDDAFDAAFNTFLTSFESERASYRPEYSYGSDHTEWPWGLS